MNRKPAVAGTFYPSEKPALEKQILEFLKTAASPTPEKIKSPQKELAGLIVPHAGYLYSGAVAGKGYRKLLGLDPEKEWEILLLGPSHYIGFRGSSISLANTWETPLGKVKVSPRAKKMVSQFIQNIPQAHQKEHSIEVQLPFISEILWKYSILPIICGEIEPELMAIELENQLKKNTILIASSDLSHYLAYDQAKEIDHMTIQAILDLDVMEMERIGDACGKIPILVLMHLARLKNWEPEIIDYQNSGDTAGDKKHVVGYCAIAFWK